MMVHVTYFVLFVHLPEQVRKVLPGGLEAGNAGKDGGTAEQRTLIIPQENQENITFNQE